MSSYSSREKMLVDLMRETNPLNPEGGIVRGFGGRVISIDGREITAYHLGGLPAEIEGKPIEYRFGIIPVRVPRLSQRTWGKLGTCGNWGD